MQDYSSRRLRAAWGGGLFAATLLLSSCGGGTTVASSVAVNAVDDSPTTTRAPLFTTAPMPTTTTPAGLAQAVPSSTPATSTPTTATEAPSDTAIPARATTTTAPPGGAPVAGPPAGSVLGVVGVTYDDVLNVRSGPGTGRRVVVRLDPHESAVEATGAARVLGEVVWWEISFDGQVGWASSDFLGYLGQTDDATAAIIELAGKRPRTNTMYGLANSAARLLATRDPISRIRITASGTLGVTADATVDVIDVGDDAVLGYRLHVFGRQLGTGYELDAVERTVLCTRGVTPEGTCL